MLVLGGGEGAPVGPARGERNAEAEAGGVRVRDDRFGPVSGGRCFFSFEFSPDRIGDLVNEYALCNIKKNKGAYMRVVKTLTLLVMTAHYSRNKCGNAKEHSAGTLVAFRTTKTHNIALYCYNRWYTQYCRKIYNII